VIIRWTASGEFPDGSAYANHGVHLVRLRWGKVTSIDANEDSQIVAKMLDAVAATGVAEASADPILS
jgi:ketosteroid isomerase-like protein